MAVMAGMPRQAPASKLILSGSLTACARRQRDVFGGGAEGALPLPIPNPDPLAEARFGDAVADLVDDAGAVAVRDEARPGDLAGGALARFDVGRVDAGSRELDADLAGAGLRRLDLADAQHLACRTVLLVIGGAHARCRHLATGETKWRRTRVGVGAVTNWANVHAYRVFSGPRAASLRQGAMLFKEFAALDEALSWARHVDAGGRDRC